MTTHYVLNHKGAINTTVCAVSVYQPRLHEFIVVVTELDENPGTSITNAAPKLYDSIRQFIHSSNTIDSIRFFERWNCSRGERWGRPDEPQEHFDEVLMEWTGRHYTGPHWRPSSRQEIEALANQVL